MRLFTVKLLLGWLVLISANANAESVLLDDYWNVVKDKKLARYYLKKFTEVINGKYKAEVYYKDNDILFCASYLADKNIGKTLASEQFRGAYQCYFEDGKPYEKGFYNEQGQLHGLLKKYISTGQLYVESHYVNGIKQGPETAYWNGGNIRYKTIFKDGKEIGISDHFSPEGEVTAKICHDQTCVSQYFNLGKLNREVHRVDGLLHGTETTWGLNGQVISTQEYVKGKRQGDYFEYFDNGKIERHYQYQADFKVGEQLTYHENGHVKLKEVTNDKGYVLQGIEYDEQGEIKNTTDSKYRNDNWVYRKQLRYSEGQLIESKEEDRLKDWALYEDYQQGELVSRREELDNKLTGLHVQSVKRRSDTKIITREHFEEGKREGPYEMVLIEHETGKRWVVEQGLYTNDKPAGTWKKQQEDATLTFSYDDNGELHGEYRNETSSGQLLELINYKHGKPDGLVQRYASNGQLYEKGTYRNGQQDGDWIFTDGEFHFSPRPNPERRYWYGRFDQGKQVAHWERRSVEDYVLEIANYDDQGKLHGKQYEFEEHGWIQVINSYNHGQFLNQEMPPPMVTSDHIFPIY